MAGLTRSTDRARPIWPGAAGPSTCDEFDLNSTFISVVEQPASGRRGQPIDRYSPVFLPASSSCTSQLPAWLVKKGHTLFDYHHFVFKEAREALPQDKRSKRGEVLASTPFADSDRSPTNLLLVTDARLRTSPSQTMELNGTFPRATSSNP